MEDGFESQLIYMLIDVSDVLEDRLDGSASESTYGGRRISPRLLWRKATPTCVELVLFEYS